MEAFGPPTQVLINESATEVLAATGAGFLTRWRIPEQGPAELLEQARAVSDGAVSALAYLLGDRSIAVGGSDGSVATWSLVRHEEAPDGWRLTRVHALPAHPAGITTLAASPRDKTFLTASADGSARLQYMTTERVLARWQMAASPRLSVIAPKTNGVLMADAQGRLHHWRVENPHPDISWQALFGKIWYEGYEQPEYIWQSTGGTDDFESKYSLMPLVFGTLKGTCYALLFAMPLALFGALYCSQFLDTRLRNPVKSTVELMAALPSVVLGFVAGVVIAPLVQHHLVAVLTMPLIVPLVGLAGMSGCVAAPWPRVSHFVRRHEFWALLVWVVIGLLVAGGLGPGIERVCFGGDFEAWLLRTTGTRYDQRNALVVGWAMGFAVVPIIFTICEDAFSSVPQHLVGASLACGASPWQTAWRVVLPAAGSGVFSAIMVGFGRAIGETMIVLMATGNTPVMDWSLFNGFRALSANIAVEIPEAPYGGTLYRVLFVAALLLFAMTFLVNTVAEIIRLRLRRQLQGI
jgi:phosphate transport system permease protein